MIKVKILTSFYLVAYVSAMSYGQTWNYAECVDYARTHSITLQKLQLNEQSYSYDLDAARAQWHPTLDFATQHTYTNMPWADNNNNTYVGQFGLNASWTVWDGGARTKSIEREKINVQKSRLDSEYGLRTLETDLLQVYLNILYARESILIYEEAEKLSLARAERMRQLMEAGKASKVDYAQLQAQHEQDCYALVNARGTYDTRRMELKRLLEIGIDRNIELEDIDIATEQILAELPPIDESFRLAVATDISLRSLKLEEDGAAVDIDIARAGSRPKISLNASASTTYAFPGNAFGEQLKRQWGENIGLTLSIPILDNKKTKTAVAKATVQQINAKLDSESRMTELAQAVENWYIDTRSAQSRYKAAEQQLEAAMTSNDLTNEQFAVGLVNPVELMDAHNNLTEARQALLQSKFMAILGLKMIEYYRTSTVSL